MILFGPEGEIVSTNTVKQLHTFAKKLGLKREWFKNLNKDGSRGYYKITSEIILLRAIALRAEEIDLTDPESREYWAHLMQDEINPLREISPYIKKKSTRSLKKEGR